MDAVSRPSAGRDEPEILVSDVRRSTRPGQYGDPVDDLTVDDLTVDDLTVARGVGVSDVVEQGACYREIDDLDRVKLFGLDLVNASSIDAVVEEILTGSTRPGATTSGESFLPLVLTPNVDIIVHLDRDDSEVERRLFARSQFCLPDGQPVVLASRLLGRPLAARLAGSDLFAQIWPRVIDEQISTVVVASSQEVADRLGAEQPNATFVIPPLFDGTDAEAVGAVAEEILAACRQQRPRLLMIGVGHPKDARVLSALYERWSEDLGPMPVGMGLGGSFAMYLGLLRRAPVLLQRLSLEWFFRFCQEPRRLFRRYFIEDLAFIGIVARERGRLGRGKEKAR